MTNLNDQEQFSNQLLLLVSSTISKGFIDPTNKDTNLSILASVCLLVKAFLYNEERIASENLFQTVCKLHDILLILWESTALQNEICDVCELWFEQGREGKERVCPQMVVFLLNQALQSNSHVADLKRLYSIQEAFLLFDFEDEQSSTIKILIQRCFLHSLFLSNTEGRKFLLFAFTSLEIVQIIHKTIQAALLSAKKWQIGAYAQIYFKSWKKAQGITLIRIEKALNDFASYSIFSKNPTILKASRTIIKQFTNQKINNNNVEALLYRIFTPILNTALQVANPKVRENSLVLLSLLFPLVSSDQDQEDFNIKLQEQFNNIVSALSDPYPEVRKEAILCLGRILSLYWEILQPVTILMILNYLVTEMAFDRSSSDVRESVFKAVQAILDNHISHELFRNKKYLTFLAPLIFDNAEKVRSACINLLEFVKKIKSIKFYEIVEYSQILDAMAYEKSTKLRKQLAHLMTPTYWPYPRLDIKETLIRCYNLINDHPDAALVFYSNANLLGEKSEIPISVPVKIIRALWKKLVKSLKFVKNNNEDENNENNENDNNDNNDNNSNKNENEEPIKRHFLQFTNENVVTFLKIISGIWDNIESQLASNDNIEQIQLLIHTFQDQQLLTFTRNFNIPELYQISTHLNVSDLPLFSNYIIESLIDENSIEVQNLKIQCLFCWNNYFPQQFMKMIIEKILFKEHNYENLEIGLKLINFCFNHSEWIRNEFVKLESFNTILNILFGFHDLFNNVYNKNIVIPFSTYSNTLSTYYKLIIHQNFINQTNTNSSFIAFKNLILWIDQTLIPIFVSFTRNEELDLKIENDCPENLDLPIAILSNLIILINDFEILNRNQNNSLDSDLSKICFKLLKCRSNISFFTILCSVCWKIISRNENNSNQIIENLDSFRLLTLIRDPTSNKKMSIFSLKKLLNFNKNQDSNLKNLIFNHLWNMTSEQNVNNDYNEQIDVLDEIPSDIEAIIDSFISNNFNLNQFTDLIILQLKNNKFSKISVWTCIQIISIISQPTKISKKIKIELIISVLNEILKNMIEKDEDESILRSRAFQISKYLSLLND